MTAGGITRWRRAALVLATAFAVVSFVGLRVAAGESAAEPIATASAAKTISIANFEYHPTPLKVSAGTKVTFANRSGVTHTATQKNGFDTGEIKPGKSVTITLKRAGTYVFHCEIHPFMHGKIVVK